MIGLPSTKFGSREGTRFNNLDCTGLPTPPIASELLGLYNLGLSTTNVKEYSLSVGVNQVSEINVTYLIFDPKLLYVNRSK
jgi:hypothetical protein